MHAQVPQLLSLDTGIHCDFRPFFVFFLFSNFTLNMGSLYNQEETYSNKIVDL